MKNMKSFAQFNEDKIVINFFLKKNIQSGVFVEFGAWDGVHLSNCKLLADNNWSGFFIEGDFLRFKECQNNYKKNNHSNSQILTLSHTFFVIFVLYITSRIK